MTTIGEFYCKKCECKFSMPDKYDVEFILNNDGFLIVEAEHDICGTTYRFALNVCVVAEEAT